MQALDKETQNQTKAFEQTLEKAKEELRDAYMSYKDLETRCVIDIRKGTRLQDENPVYYFKPETFLLDEPEKQRVYRQKLLSKIGNVPKPPPIVYLGDMLHKSMSQSVADQSTPKLTKQNLCEYFKRRQYQLQHLKYKMLCRWAHHNLTQETSENIGIQATFMYGKLEYNLEQAILRIERLKVEDFYEPTVGFSRPTTQPQGEGCSLYVEKFDLKPQSLLREDDIEVYMRGVAHKSKLNKVQTKFLSRLKWLPMLKKFDIYEASVQDYYKLKQQNIERQSQFLANAKMRAQKSQIMTPKLEQELDAIFDRAYCNQYEKQFAGPNDKTVNYWKPIHDDVPQLIQDQYSLRQQIVETAKCFGLFGDIELDQGFSFSYQVSVFFPTNLYKQILKSQFSIYDSHDDDPNKQMKRTFNQMAKFDINIFKDISTAKHSLPSEEAFQQEIKDQDIKVMRMKSSEYWLSYVVLEATEPEWHHKQQAVLNQNNPIDTLLINGFNFIDVNDLATINRINEDNIQLHLKSVAKTLQCNPNSEIVKCNVATADGDKVIDVQRLQERANNIGQIEEHLLAAVSEEPKTAQIDAKHESFIPGHLLTTYFTLRFMQSKDAKTRLLYTLNYFRAIQRRLALDLREFATRDRINSQFANPFVPSQESNQMVINKINLSVNAFEKVQRNAAVPEWKINTKMTVFSDEQIKRLKNMASLRQYKQNGSFNNQVLSTCPAFPRFHVANGEPLSRTEDEQNVMGKALKLMGRVQKVELNEVLREVYIKDDFGIYVIYDCVLQDMKCFEQELAKICSHFIHKSEVLRDPTTLHNGQRPFPSRDRLEILKDILVLEAEFNFKKVLLCQVYMECYEHVTDPLDQQKLMQVITDIMARRPRLNLEANYFTDAYNAELECLQKQFELVKTLVDLQISVEVTENRRLQESINLSYKMADEYATNKWKYQDAETLLQSVVGSKADPQFEAEPQQTTKKRQKSEGLWKEDSSSVSDDQCYQEEKDKFSRLLGLEQISLESIYLSYQQKDVNILKIMSEHSHFIQCHEGYPEFLQYTHKQLSKPQLYNPWSQPMGSLDFFETLDFIIKFQQVTSTVQSELNTALTPWDNTLATIIDTQIAIVSLDEFRKVIQIQEGFVVDYKGREVVEDESILGNADRMTFYAKELVADLTNQPKSLLDPYIVSKLDLETIKYFDFPQLPVDLNKYTQRSKGIQGFDYLLKVEKSTIEGIAKNIGSLGEKGEIEKMLKGKVSDTMNLRNVIVPSMLHLYCNMVEMHRLRSELIIAVAESNILTDLYMAQAEIVGQKLLKLVQSEGISFQMQDQKKFVNFVDDGPSHMLEIDVAIKEFDPALLSNFNFRNADSFKLCILSSGLEELRAVLQYQILQKHLLIVATRINQLIIDSHQKAYAELNLISKKLVVPNSVIDCSKIFNKNQDTINQSMLKSERSQYKLSLSSNCQPVFYNIINKKQTQRTQISKEFFQFHTKIVNKYPLHEHIVLRIMRNYKLKLLTRFVQSALTEVYLDAQKIQAVQACQELRVFNRYFSFDSNLGLSYETCPLLENYTHNYLPPEFLETSGLKDNKKHVEVKVLDRDTIVSFRGIPSSLSLLMVESAPLQELKQFKQKQPNLKPDEQKELDSQLDLEISIKNLLPTHTSDDSLHEYKESLNFSDSQYAKLVTYYLLLERILQQEWFQQKLKLTQQEQIQLEHCIKSGMLYWQRDQFDERKQQPTFDKAKQGNSLSQQFLHAQVEALKSKQNIQQVMVNLSMTIHSFISQHEKNHDYLPQYYEFKYQTIAGSLHRLAYSFLLQKNINAANTCRQGIKDLCGTQHFKVSYLKPNNYSVYSCVLDTGLDSSNFVFGRYLQEDINNFRRCVQPIVNEQALEPSQITLFQSLYQQDNLKKDSLFVGQYQQNQFNSLNWVLLGLSCEDRVYANSFIGLAKNQANDFMETVFNDSAMAKLTSEEAYNLEQLLDAKKFINEQTQALLYKNALTCWVENQPLPTSIKDFVRFEENFKQRFFWKQMIQKQELQKKQIFVQIPSESELNILKQRIDDLSNDQNLATDHERNKRDELVKALKEEFFLLKKKVTLDNYYNLKAQIHVFSNEIEKFLIQASVVALTSECTALSKCFIVQVPKIQYHIHPFQQFAATIFDQVDPNLHLDIFNKISHVQVMLTKLRNRSTEVETLTSGPGMVFTVKDFNDIFNEFCRSTIKSQEEQFKSRTDTLHQMQESYRELLYTKDMQLKTLKNRIDVISTNLESIIDARLFEKGNQLIYELDSSKRVLSLYKSQFVGLEQHILSKVLGEQLQKFQRQAITNDINRVKFGQYKEAIQTMINNDWEQNAAEIKLMLKAKADQAKRTDNYVQRVQIYQGLEGAVVPAGFKHYPNCSCYVPNPDHPRPTLELAEMEMLSEREAREELCKMCDLMRKQRLLFKTKEMLIRSKYQDEINLLKKQLNSNKSLWDQLSESQKREKVISQELLFTQQQLSSSEKTILTMKDEIKHIDMEKARLLNFKTTQYERLKELEAKVKQSDMDNKLDTNKMIQKLIESTQENEQLKKQVVTIQQQSSFVDSKSQIQVEQLQKRFQQEQLSKVQMAAKIEQMKLEIKMLETTHNDAVQLHWKQKCLEVFDVCQLLKNENESLRSKCTDLIQKGISLAESVQRSESRQQSTKVSDKPMYSTTTSIKQHLNSSLRIPVLNPLKAPSTQNGIRNEYVKNDIRSVLTGVPKRLQSVDQPPSQSIKQRKYMLDQYGSIQKSMQFDVQGTTIASPRTKMMQSRKQARHILEDSIIM